MKSLKQKMKQLLIEKEHKNYEKQLSEKKMTYADWIEKQERKLQIENIIITEKSNCLTNDIQILEIGGDKSRNEGFYAENELLLLSVKASFFQSKKTEAFEELHRFWTENKTDVILFELTEGKKSKICLPLLYEKISEHKKGNKNQILIYGDEDVEDEGDREKSKRVSGDTSVRKLPWFKPDWSPDTFLSSFYFGSLAVVKAENFFRAWEQVKALWETKEKNGSREWGEFFYEILFGMLKEADAFSLRKEEKEQAVCHIPEILFHSKREGYEAVKHWKISEEMQKAVLPKAGNTEGALPQISIIIPSKDNPEVLFTCIHSVTERTVTEYPYEIIIVDNGSGEENKKQIEEKAEQIKEKFGKDVRYYFKPMPFNFSRMCNLGVEKAGGELLLFLNDDMEVIEPKWLSKLAEKALLPYAGAVGAKLLYPESLVIQHAGITNLRVGPAHKLQFLSDETNHYYGRNRSVHDMLGVTGACLMVRKEVFLEAGGFAEELAVAFNDVDLCYTIFEAGYYNMVRNDVALYHHESLSRGKDGDSEEKQLRLLKEKDILYERHREIYGKDPFYHKYLTNDMLESEYAPAFRYQVTLEMPWAEVKKEASLSEKIREDKCVVIGMECAMDIYKWKYGVAPEKGRVKEKSSDMGYYFQGYSFIIGADNACYKKTLLLQNKADGSLIKIPVDARYRQDIKDNLKDQLNVDLTGFAAKVQMEKIPKGTYRFGMLAQDKCSRQQLVSWSGWVLKRQ